MNYLHQFIYGIYPYIALGIFLVGSIVSFKNEQHSVIDRSAKIFQQENLLQGNILFFVGIFGLFIGHAAALFMPNAIVDASTSSHGYRQMIATVTGGVFGVMCMAGLLILLHRRLTDTRMSKLTNFGDKLLLLWLFVTLSLGLASIYESVKYVDGYMMIIFKDWIAHIITFQSTSTLLIITAPFVFKAHLLMAISLFVIFPFTRLLPIWSRFFSAIFIDRNAQLVRSR